MPSPDSFFLIAFCNNAARYDKKRVKKVQVKLKKTGGLYPATLANRAFVKLKFCSKFLKTTGLRIK